MKNRIPETKKVSKVDRFLPPKFLESNPTRSTTKRPLWANLASASRGSKSYSWRSSAFGWGKNIPGKYRKASRFCGYASKAAKTNISFNIKNNSRHLWGQITCRDAVVWQGDFDESHWSHSGLAKANSFAKHKCSDIKLCHLEFLWRPTHWERELKISWQ